MDLGQISSVPKLPKIPSGSRPDLITWVNFLQLSHNLLKLSTMFTNKIHEMSNSVTINW